MTSVRLALATLLVLTGTTAAATLPTDPAPRTVVQADRCQAFTCTHFPPRDAETQREADALLDVYTAAFDALKVEEPR